MVVKTEKYASQAFSSFACLDNDMVRTNFLHFRLYRIRGQGMILRLELRSRLTFTTSWHWHLHTRCQHSWTIAIYMTFTYFLHPRGVCSSCYLVALFAFFTEDFSLPPRWSSLMIISSFIKVTERKLTTFNTCSLGPVSRWISSARDPDSWPFTPFQITDSASCSTVFPTVLSLTRSLRCNTGFNYLCSFIRIFWTYNFLSSSMQGVVRE